MAGPRYRLVWRGDEVNAKLKRAAADAINETLGLCVRQAKANHSGWQNRTGTAEGSIGVQQVAYAQRLIGQWGSRGVDYMVWLEFLHGHALQSAADLEYPQLASRIRERMR